MNTLLVLLVAVRVVLFELAGAACIIVGLNVLFGPGAAWIGVGVAVLAKSFEWDVAERKARD